MSIKDLYSEIPIGVCVVRKDRKTMDVLYANPSMQRFFESAGNSAALTGRKLDDLWPGKDGQELVKQLKSTAPPKTFILPLQEKEGDKARWLKLDIERGDWEGTECHTLWATDISSSKQAEETLKKEVKKADALAEMKSNFLATMSHEIRTPMQSIYGLLELVSMENPAPEIGKMIKTAQESASGLLEILDDILDLAKMDANKMELDVFEVPVRLLVRGILEALSVKVQGVSIDLRDDIHEDVPFVVIGDPKRLRQIIMNLVSNALKFTEQGAVTVRVTRDIQKIKPPKGEFGLRFEVIDTGIGMPPEVCKKLFASFTQADSSTSRKYGGTGLGLSICKKLVELMGGQIGVHSEVNKGSTFWFEIPTEEVSTEVTTIELPDLDGISVLSVEDHPQGAKEIVGSLRSMGASVENCGTYAEGLSLALARPFDVAVIDQGLPDGLGLDLIKEIMQQRPNMGMIMYTVRDDIGLQHSLQALGAKYLTKPASRAGLGEAVRDAARNAHAVRIDGPHRLLIAEDTQNIRDVLQRQLEKLGIDFDFAVNGTEARQMLQTGEYGLLITDLHMPECDGYELTAQIRQEEKLQGKDRFPIVVLTADVQMSKREAYMEHGFDECLLKPVSIGQIRGLLTRWGLIDNGRPAEDVPSADEKPQTGGTANRSKEKSTKQAVDLEAMKDMMGADDDIAIEMLHKFIEMTEPLINKLRAAQKENDRHNLGEIGHSLKGAARTACCEYLGDLAGDLQILADTDKDAGNLVSQIEEEFERVRQEIYALKAA